MPLEPSPEWSSLKGALITRLRQPTGRVVFVVYFFAVVILLGGMGWLIPLCRFYFAGDMTAINDLPAAFATFALASIAGAMADLVINACESTARRDTNAAVPRESNGFRVCMFGLSLLGIVFAFAALQTNLQIWGFIASVCSLLISLLLWWLLNATNSRFHENTEDPTPAIGGPVSLELTGSTDGLTD